MSSKNNIFKRLIAAGMPQRSWPDFDFAPQRFDNPEAMFADRLKTAGGRFVRMDKDETLDDVVRKYYPEARAIASSLPEVSTATLNPESVEKARQLVDVDLGVVSGCFGVAENGAVWIVQDIRYKALYFGATALMVVIPNGALVDTMHEAVLRPETADFDYGCFMSGPSKTADIEQALVFGAHGPMSVTVVMRD